MVYGDIFKKPYMIDPSVISDERKVSFHATKNQDFYAFFQRYLSNLNIRIYSKNGVDFIKFEEPVKIAPVIKTDMFVYHPKYRSVQYLGDILNSLKEKGFGVTSGVGEGNAAVGSAVPDSASERLSRSGDRLVYQGTPSNLVQIKKILEAIDVPSDIVEITGYLYEVTTDQHNGSGMQLAAKLLSGKIGVTLGKTSGYSNYISLNTGNIDALYELFATDSRFSVVSAPRLTVDSGEKANFTVGSDVPVVGQTVINGQNILQGVEYQSSGVIFTVKPTVYSERIQLEFTNELSNFAATTTGVTESPTKYRRTISTNVSISDGAVLVVGGLAQNKITKNTTGLNFLPRLFSQDSDGQERTDLIALIQVKTAHSVKSVTSGATASDRRDALNGNPFSKEE